MKLQSGLGRRVVTQVNFYLLTNLIQRPIGDLVVEVASAQTRVARCGNHLDPFFLHCDNGNVEGAATQVVDQIDFALWLIMVQTVTYGGCGGFRDELPGIKAGQQGRFLGGFLLFFREVGWHGDDCIAHLFSFSKLLFRNLLHFHQNEGTNLLWEEPLVVQQHLNRVALITLNSFLFGPGLSFAPCSVFVEGRLPKGFPHLSLDFDNGVLRVEGHVAFGQAPNYHPPGLGIQRNYRRCSGCLVIFLITDNLRLLADAVEQRHSTVGGTQINANDSVISVVHYFPPLVFLALDSTGLAISTPAGRTTFSLVR